MDSAAKRSTIPVAIVGGGPVGLVLASFLDRYGVRSVLFNSEEGQRAHPKGSTHNARTLEHFRRLGISEPVRRLGLPDDHPTDVAYFTRFNACELARFRMPSEAEKMRAVALRPRPIRSPSRSCVRTRCMSRRSCSTMHGRGPISRCASAGR